MTLMKLAIKGHWDRGAEVIEALERLGGINVDNLDGDETYYYYTITDDKEIDAVLFKYSDDEACIFSLEEFEQKFPYKVGDKVYNIIHNKNQTITNLAWDPKENEVVYQTNNYEYLFVNYLLPYKEKTTEDMEGVYANNEINCYHQDFGDKVRIRLGGDFEIKVEGKITYIVKKKPQYPKTYEECCKVLGYEPNRQSVTGYHAELIENFQQLLICRDAYLKIYGEQMGLDKPWEPDWMASQQNKYCLYKEYGNIKKVVLWSANSIIAFPTEEMRNEFYKNFKELIEECKELL